jgi:hypothetical protein
MHFRQLLAIYCEQEVARGAEALPRHMLRMSMRHDCMIARCGMRCNAKKKLNADPKMHQE